MPDPTLPTVLPIPPARLALRPRDRHGRIVPAFAADVDGQPDHRIASTDAIRRASEMRLCFLCDLPLGPYGAFVIGPMCLVNRVSPEPPSHRTCAEFAVQACPFLTNPTMRRRKTGIPEAAVEPDGNMCLRNPGVCAVYTTQEWNRQRGRDLFGFRNPFEVSWWTRGRRATYPEALDGMVSGLEILRAEADQDTNPERAHSILAVQYERALELLPGTDL
jgi:hypothetical protein